MNSKYIFESKLKEINIRCPFSRKKGIIFSFDVESWPGCTHLNLEPSDIEDEYFKFIPKLLDLFDYYSIKAHFFVCGKVIEHYPNIMKTLLERGHGIGGHGYSHELMSMLSHREQKDIIGKVDLLMREKVGTKLESWRSPQLAVNSSTYRIQHDFGISLTSNAKRGSPMIIEGVLEIPMTGKMDGDIMGYERRKKSKTQWADYMKNVFDNKKQGILVFGMHTWVQRQADPEFEALRSFINYLKLLPDEVWIGTFNDLKWS